MKRKKLNRKYKLILSELAILPGMIRAVMANPQGLSVQSGSATPVTSGSQLNITVSQAAVLNWQSFNINKGESTIFHQPSANSVVFNNIGDANASQILGNLSANGTVILENRNGFFIGKDSFISVGSLVLSTAGASPLDNTGSSGFWQFNGPPPKASIINYGTLRASTGGSIFVIADSIENHGSIQAPGGSVGLLAGQKVLLSERPDGLGLSAEVTLPSGSVDNSGTIIADAGTIALNAKTINQDGVIQANSVREVNGTIELIASDAINLGSSSQISANGDNSSTPSAAGKITVKSSGTFTDTASSAISVAGGTFGGNGGQVEISAESFDAINSSIDGHAQTGNTGGQLLIDPTTITIGNTGTGSAGSGSTTPTSPAGALSLNALSAFKGFSQIDLQASASITVNSLWNLSTSAGPAASTGSTLKLEAGTSINIANNAGITGGDRWSLNLSAGRDFTSPTAVKSGTGSISLTGNGFLETTTGSIKLLAGNSVNVGTGYVRTDNGGAISVTAVGGSVNTGTGVNGYDFLPGTYQVNPALSGISTANGGNVSITAGKSITSYLPVPAGVETDAGSGAFGAAAGDVTLTAGGDITGHYLVANGTGTINAGGSAGNSGTPLALSLITGGWTVNAVKDIYLQEIRNPNGIFNNVGFGNSSAYKHYFDYSGNSYATLTAGNSVQLLGANLPRYSDDIFEQAIPPIYPASLTVTAGAGGVTLGNDVILFPSAQGQLSVTTTGGGSLTGTKAGDLSSLILSDSGKNQYQSSGDFGISDHADKPLHLVDNTPLFISISGDMNNILIGSPKAATISVAGNVNNSRFQGQNLHDTDKTSIVVKGDIINRNEFTSVTLATAPDFTVFDNIYPPLAGTLSSLPTLFQYNATTKQLTFQGRMTGDQEAALLNLTVKVFDVFGMPVLDVNGDFVTQPASFVSASVIQQLFNASQDIPVNPNTGYLLGGGGKFNISAHNLDLGATVGIVSTGPRDNPALANYLTRGADLELDLTGYLDMFSTTISSINGGSLAINAGGYANIGSSYFSAPNGAVRGVFTVDKSDISLIAGGNININGSRIAAYDGGNITVRSLTGNVDAGNGGINSASVEKIVVDPVTREILTFQPNIPGSGILATSFPNALGGNFPPSLNSAGNILIETPQGSINANSGGVEQVPFNGVDSSGSTVVMKAGSRDSSGKILYVGDIDVSNSGVIGSVVDLDATGSIKGIVVARNHLGVNAAQNVNLSAISLGDAHISAGDSLQGTIIAVGSLSAGSTGGSITASLLSQNVSTSGTVSSSQVGFAPVTVANSTSSSSTSAIQNDEATRRTASYEDPDLKKRGGFGSQPLLSKSLGRVTVILPKTY